MSASPDVSCCQEGQVPVAVVSWHTDCPWSAALRMLSWPPRCPPPEICWDWHGHICWIHEFQVVESCCGVTWLTVPCPLSWSSSCTLLCCPFHEWGRACAASGVFLQDQLLGKREGSAPLVRLVFGSPVRSGLLTPRAMDHNSNRSIYFQFLKKTGLNQYGPVHIGFFRLQNRSEPVIVQTGSQPV